MTRRRAKGVRRHGAGWQAYVRVGGVLHTQVFPLVATLDEMQAWRDRTRAEHRQPTAPAPLRGTFAADVSRYLKAVASMPTYAERAAQMALWVATLGPERDRRTVTTDEITDALHRWALTGKDGGPLAPSTLLHRRNALLHLWHILDGKEAPNPVRRAWRPRDRPPAARALPPDLIQRILDALTVRKGKQKTRARLLVLATTGLPQAQLEQLTARDLETALQTGRLRVRGRKKGSGTADRVLPVTPPIRLALAYFAEQDAFGPYSTSSQWKTWQRACQKVGAVGARPYDLKHSFGTLLYRAGRDLAAVARLLGVSLQTAQRYTLGAHEDVDTALLLATPLATFNRTPADVAGHSPEAQDKFVK